MKEELSLYSIFHSSPTALHECNRKFDLKHHTVAPETSEGDHSFELIVSGMREKIGELGSVYVKLNERYRCCIVLAVSCVVPSATDSATCCLWYRYMNCSITTAASIEECSLMDTDNDDGGDDAVYSSLADDVVYIVQKCVNRAVATGDADVVCAILNNSVDMLKRWMLALLADRVNKNQGWPRRRKAGSQPTVQKCVLDLRFDTAVYSEVIVVLCV